MTKFKDDLVRADKYEKELINYAKKYYDDSIVQVFDVRGDKFYQQKDIDFVMLKKDTSVVTVEAKIDFYPTKNFWFEKVSHKKYNSEGCILKSKSDEIWYYSVVHGDLFIIKTKKLQNWLNKQVILTDGGDNALGVKIPHKQFYYKVGYRKIGGLML